MEINSISNISFAGKIKVNGSKNIAELITNKIRTKDINPCVVTSQKDNTTYILTGIDAKKANDAYKAKYSVHLEAIRRHNYNKCVQLTNAYNKKIDKIIKKAKPQGEINITI